MTVANRKTASTNEIVDALNRLSDADLRRLEMSARFRTIGHNELDWRDLFNEAVIRLLNGSRHWPRDVTLVTFLRETMRSIISDYRRGRRNRPVLLETELQSGDDRNYDVVENTPDLTGNPERQASDDEILAKIEAVFRDDPEAMLVITGMACGKSPTEIQEGADMNSTQYATTQRRIRRTLTREFPDKGVLQ